MAAEMRANAEGQATQIRGKAEAEATKSYAIFQQDPVLANYLFKLTALESSTQEKTTLIFDPRTEPFDLFHGVPTNIGNIKR